MKGESSGIKIQVGIYVVQQNSVGVKKILGPGPGACEVGLPKKWSI